MTNLHNDLEIAREAAQAGASIILENYGKSKDSRVKGNSKGLVTNTDLEAEKVILEILKSKSNHGILSEESGLLGTDGGFKWVVDPINQKEYFAISGGGAFCNSEKITLPKFDTNYSSMLFLNHGYAEIDREKFKKLSKRLASNYNILKLGTTALELCYIAEGSVDGFICSGDELWDFAAGIVIAKEAGCIFTDWEGNSWDGKNNHLLFARPEIHEELVEVLKDLQ